MNVYNVKLGDYSMYKPERESRPVPIRNLYKGVVVTVSMEGVTDPRNVFFTIRTKKVSSTIWKRNHEQMDKLVFDDESLTITCVYGYKAPENPAPNSLTFEKVVYDELKENIPAFMIEQGCFFKEEVSNHGLTLTFTGEDL